MSLSILPARDFCGLVIVLCWGLSGAIAAAQQFSPVADFGIEPHPISAALTRRVREGGCTQG
jgi:hypothetical protein